MSPDGSDNIDPHEYRFGSSTLSLFCIPPLAAALTRVQRARAEAGRISLALIARLRRIAKHFLHPADITLMDSEPKSVPYILIARCDNGHEMKLMIQGSPDRADELAAAIGRAPTLRGRGICGECGAPFTCSVKPSLAQAQNAH